MKRKKGKGMPRQEHYRSIRERRPSSVGMVPVKEVPYSTLEMKKRNVFDPFHKQERNQRGGLTEWTKQ